MLFLTLAEAAAQIGRLEQALAFWSEIRTQAPEDLRSLGIDTPYLRWSLASTYLRQLRVSALSDVTRATIEIVIYGHAKQEWIREGKPGFSPNRSHVADAILWAKQTFCQPNVDAA